MYIVLVDENGRTTATECVNFKTAVSTYRFYMNIHGKNKVRIAKVVVDYNEEV